MRGIIKRIDLRPIRTKIKRWLVLRRRILIWTSIFFFFDTRDTVYAYIGGKIYVFFCENAEFSADIEYKGMYVRVCS